MATSIEAKPSLLHHEHEHNQDGGNPDYYDYDADRSYKFSFETEDHSREEEADENGLVIGKYTYVDENGLTRTLTYKAGANIGFVPNLDQFGDFGKKMEPETPANPPVPSTFYEAPAPSNPATLYEAPVNPSKPASLYEAPAPVNPPQPATLYEAPAPSNPSKPASLYEAPAPVNPPQPATLYEAPAPSNPPKPATLYEAPAPVNPPQTLYSAPANNPQISTLYEAPSPANPLPVYEESAPAGATMMNMDASYSFAYNGDESSRQEESDPNGNIKGSYQYIDSEGKTIKVHYSAGAETGFVIESQDEISEDQDWINDPNEIAEVSKLAQEAFNHPLNGHDQNLDQYGQNLDQYGQNLDQKKTEEESSIFFQQPTIDQDTWIQSKSYEFGYENDLLQRNEIAQNDGSVQGSYTIPDVNGEPIVVKYRAGSKTGFVIDNFAEVQQRTNPEFKAKRKMKVVKKPRKKPAVQINNDLSNYSPRFEKRPEPLENSDASFAFKVESQDLSHEEKSNAEGERTGSYSYTDPTGRLITVKYRAGKNGFVILNPKDVLPKPPQAY